jgi:hypothetical protein
VRSIGLPIPIIPRDVIVATRWAILPPTFIISPKFIPLSVENTLHVPYSLLVKIKETKGKHAVKIKSNKTDKCTTLVLDIQKK